MSRIYAIHDDAEALIGDPCLLDDGNYGYIIVVMDNEEYDAFSDSNSDANPLKVFLVYDYGKDDCYCVPVVEPITHVSGTMERTTADRIGISLAINALEARVATKPSPYYWNDPSKSELSITDWIDAAVHRAQQSVDATGDFDAKTELIDAILGLVIAYNRILLLENEDGTREIKKS